MERIAVQSSNVREIGYDPATQTLEVQFHPGRKTGLAAVWQYAPVDAETWNALQEPDVSIGAIVNTIKRSAPGTHISDEQVEVLHA